MRKDLQPYLMESKAAGVKDPYYYIQGQDHTITVITSGKNGAEYNKTIGFFNKYQGAITFTCLYGQGVVVMQRNDEFGEAKEFRVATISQGKQVELPSGWGHSLINIGKKFLLVINNHIPNKLQNPEPIKVKKGLAYYVVEKKGEVGFETNPNYRVRPQITTAM
ncbi:hypothetical protein HYW42_03320 [Candidatus Daviesbacteria bacterium]|nr:hypothetical protein [Candidatus Daviesbacteria bacterium]